MYLKRLGIQGYKSFAARTEFTFDEGITAIVGPNGSGKSNIADAIRWVLGEQSYSALRAKRTEDLIFSGSAHRARVGMAEVSIVLDNTSQWLPIDFSEVTIMRRAARSGENEYYLNGNRVRLRDIVEMLTRAGLGRNASAVIGQGQVDTALSLRPEERRSLFEEAAGVRIHIEKRDEAYARLDETRRNLERLNDILSEITPRLESLRRQAERAHEHESVKQELEEALLTWYGYQWLRHQDRLARVAERSAEHSERVAQQRQTIQRTVSERETLRERQQTLRESLRTQQCEAEQARSRIEDLRRQLAVAQERSGSMLRQEEQVESDLAGVEMRRAGLLENIRQQEAELAALAKTIEEQQAAMAAARLSLNTAEAALRAQREELERTRATAFEIATAHAAARNRLSQLQRRKADLEEEAAKQRAAATEAETRVAGAAEALRAAEDQRQHITEDLAQVDNELRQAEDNLAATLTRLDSLRSERDTARESYQKLRTQYDVLRRARSQGTHLHAGAQAVIRENMPSVVGTVGSLVRTPAELEPAVEAALGGHLQDVVVKTWNDAVACVELLKRRRRGRGTFLPLDYIRPRPVVPSPQLPGVRGTAARLVSTDPAYQSVCDLLLGNIVIVDNLEAGRKALAAERRLQRAVTLDGDTVEARGAVRGGARPQGRGFLAQEREWRELPGRLSAAREALAKVEEAVRQEDERQQSFRAVARQCAQQLQEYRRSLAQQEQRVSALRQRYDRLAQEVSWRRSLEEQAGQAFSEVEVDIAQVEGEIAAIEINLAETNERIAVLRAQAERDDLQDLRRRAAECETALAVSLRSKQTQEQFLASQREALVSTNKEVQARNQQLERLRQETGALDQRLGELARLLETARQAHKDRSQPLAQTEAELRETECELEAMEKAEGQARQDLQTLLTEQNRLSFERDRVEEDIAEIKRQMEAELGPIEVPDVDQARQLRLSLGTGTTPLPQVTQLPDGLTARLKEMRARLRRLGGVNASAPAEYEQVLQRHQFLSDQIADLTRAADSTREIINELNRLIRENFTATFAKVAREFSSCFSTLFNGGHARLLLSDPDNPADSGIEIIAQPPGKRAQSLSLLSGGERALTAASLLFALLKVNPLPFCVLDEVDAMLDESNVHRFRAFLESLSSATQFIVITHNRWTVEAATTVYGISMAREGMSQVLSLVLPEKPEEQEAEAAGEASAA